MNDRWLPRHVGPRHSSGNSHHRVPGPGSAACSAISPRTRPARPADPDGLARQLHLLHDGIGPPPGSATTQPRWPTRPPRPAAGRRHPRLTGPAGDPATPACPRRVAHQEDGHHRGSRSGSAACSAISPPRRAPLTRTAWPASCTCSTTGWPPPPGSTTTQPQWPARPPRPLPDRRRHPGLTAIRPGRAADVRLASQRRPAIRLDPGQLRGPVAPHRSWGKLHRGPALALGRLWRPGRPVNGSRGRSGGPLGCRARRPDP